MLALTIASAVASSSPLGRRRDDYTPLPRNLLVQGELLFTRLPISQLAAVRITSNEAIYVAESDEAPVVRGSRVVVVSLGGYVNKNFIVHDWVGTKTLIPKAVPSYVVRLYEPYPVASPSIHSPNVILNHYLNVIVNAETGKVVETFTYD